MDDPIDLRVSTIGRVHPNNEVSVWWYIKDIFGEDFYFVNRQIIHTCCRRKSWTVMTVWCLSILQGRFAFEVTMSCWDTGMTKKRLTPVLIPAVGFTVGKYFIKCSAKTQKWRLIIRFYFFRTWIVCWRYSLLPILKGFSHDGRKWIHKDHWENKGIFCLNLQVKKNCFILNFRSPILNESTITYCYRSFPR